MFSVWFIFMSCFSPCPLCPTVPVLFPNSALSAFKSLTSSLNLGPSSERTVVAMYVFFPLPIYIVEGQPGLRGQSLSQKNQETKLTWSLLCKINIFRPPN